MCVNTFTSIAFILYFPLTLILLIEFLPCLENSIAYYTWNEDCDQYSASTTLFLFDLHGITGYMLVLGNYREYYMLYHWLIITLHQIALMMGYIIYAMLLTDKIIWYWGLISFGILLSGFVLVILHVLVSKNRLKNEIVTKVLKAISAPLDAFNYLLTCIQYMDIIFKMIQVRDVIVCVALLLLIFTTFSIFWCLLYEAAFVGLAGEELENEIKKATSPYFLYGTIIIIDLFFLIHSFVGLLLVYEQIKFECIISFWLLSTVFLSLCRIITLIKSINLNSTIKIITIVVLVGLFIVFKSVYNYHRQLFRIRQEPEQSNDEENSNKPNEIEQIS